MRKHLSSERVTLGWLLAAAAVPLSFFLFQLKNAAGQPCYQQASHRCGNANTGPFTCGQNVLCDRCPADGQCPGERTWQHSWNGFDDYDEVADTCVLEEWRACETAQECWNPDTQGYPCSPPESHTCDVTGGFHNHEQLRWIDKGWCPPGDPN